MTVTPLSRQASASLLTFPRSSGPFGAATGEFSMKQFCMSTFTRAVRFGSTLKSTMVVLLCHCLLLLLAVRPAVAAAARGASRAHLLPVDRTLERIRRAVQRRFLPHLRDQHQP